VLSRSRIENDKGVWDWAGRSIWLVARLLHNFLFEHPLMRMTGHDSGRPEPRVQPMGASPRTG
jgi:hypothetical protein